MLSRRAFPFLVILGLSATTVVFAAGNGRSSSTPAPVGTPSVEIRPVGSDTSHPAWNRLLQVYRSVLGMQLLQVVSDPEIEGVQDGPDGVDPLGIRPHGIKGLIPKYQEENPPPVPAQ